MWSAVFIKVCLSFLRWRCSSFLSQFSILQKHISSSAAPLTSCFSEEPHTQNQYKDQDSEHSLLKTRSCLPCCQQKYLHPSARYFVVAAFNANEQMLAIGHLMDLSRLGLTVLNHWSSVLIVLDSRPYCTFLKCKNYGTDYF